MNMDEDCYERDCPMDVRYQKTIYACFVGYIVQAIVNNFAPLLFLTFHRSYGIPLSRITYLVTFNFALQLLVDLVSVRFVDRIGYRAALILAHLTAAFGLVMLAVLPVTSIIFLASFVPCCMGTEVPVKFWHLCVIWLERMILSILITGIFAMILFPAAMAA